MNDLINLPPAATLPEHRVIELRERLLHDIAAAETPATTPRHRRTPWLLGSAAAALAAVALAGPALFPQPAYATWTSSPDTLGASETTLLGSECAASVHRDFPDAATDLRATVGERRGDFRTVVLAGPKQVSVCADWLGVSSATEGRGSSFAALTVDADIPAARSVALLGVPGQLNGPDAARIAYGLVDPRVSTLTVTTTDGRDVLASVGNGHFVAWWPSGAEAETVVAKDVAGRVLDQVPGTP